MAQSEIPSSTEEMLERGRFALQAIQYQERAARFKAAASSLQAAMLQAESGDAVRLKEWLDREAEWLTHADFDFAQVSMPTSTNTPVQHTDSLVALNTSKSLDDHAVSPSSDLRQPDWHLADPWPRMQAAALMRREQEPEFKQIDAPEQESHSEFLRPELNDESDAWSSDSEPESDTANEDQEVTLSPNLVQAIESTVSQEQTQKAWWAAPHVYVSFVLHAILIGVLSYAVITVSQEQPAPSVVSAAYEGENVLMETPMEMVSDSMTTSPEPPPAAAPSISADLPNISSDISIGSAVRADSLPISVGGTGASIAGAISGTAQGMNGSGMKGSQVLSGAEFFGVKATGNTFVYIVDSSPSMRRDGAFEAARQELVRSLTSMKPKQRYFISFFGKEIDPMVFQTGVEERYPVYATPENLNKTMNWLNRVQIQKDGWPPNDALSEAIEMQPDGIFLLFDGDTKVDVAKYLRKVNRSDDILTAGSPKVPIHVVHFFQEEFTKQMRLVAEENGGTYRFVPRPEKPKGKR